MKLDWRFIILIPIIIIIIVVAGSSITPQQSLQIGNILNSVILIAVVCVIGYIAYKYLFPEDWKHREDDYEEWHTQYEAKAEACLHLWNGHQIELTKAPMQEIREAIKHKDQDKIIYRHVIFAEVIHPEDNLNKEHWLVYGLTDEKKYAIIVEFNRNENVTRTNNEDIVDMSEEIGKGEFARWADKYYHEGVKKILGKIDTEVLKKRVYENLDEDDQKDPDVFKSLFGDKKEENDKE